MMTIKRQQNHYNYKQMSHHSKQPSPSKLNQIKQPPRRQYSTLSTCEYNQVKSVFGLPVPVLESAKQQYRSQREKMQIREKIDAQSYGELALNYEENLRKTVFTHAKNLFKRRKHSFNKKISLPTTLHLNNKSHSIPAEIQERSSPARDALSILQKVILKDADTIQASRQLIPIQTNKLPMLIRKQSIRAQIKRQQYLKYHSESVKSEPRHQNVNVVKYQKKEKLTKRERPEICGWEEQQYPDF